MTTAWDTLNERQRLYMQALYTCDQVTEAAQKIAVAQGHWGGTPASVWRWQMYGPTEPVSDLYTLLAASGSIDQDTGATWQALEVRGFVHCRTVRDALGVQLLEVQITPKGRQLVRRANGEQGRKLQELREHQWAALAQLASAGDKGIDNDVLLHSRGGFNWYTTIRRLLEWSPKPLVVYGGGGMGRYYITEAGRAFYAKHWHRYCELYPSVEAPEPH